MRSHTKAFAFYLPLMVMMTLLGWLVFGALPGMALTSDLIAWLMELPITTCYALAAGGATLVTMHWTGINIPNDQRDALRVRAANGDVFARRILDSETHAWLAFLVVYAVFFFPHW